MTTDAGRTVVQYIVGCALPAGQTAIEDDQLGNPFTFTGRLGLAPQLATGACDASCQEILSACLLAHVNTAGVRLPLWLTSAEPGMGLDRSDGYPIEEATFYGNLWQAAPDGAAYYCAAASASDAVVLGRVGSLPGDGTLQDEVAADRQYRSACALRSSFSHAITVWRGRAYEAEDAMLWGTAAIITGCKDGCARLHGRIGNLGPGSSVVFQDVTTSSSGTNQIAVYYANGDSGSGARELGVSVNGGPPQVESFRVVAGGDWGRVGLLVVTASGFRAGANTIAFTAGADAPGPDLDWIEVVPELAPLP